jgi:hypothetical protein
MRMIMTAGLLCAALLVAVTAAVSARPLADGDAAMTTAPVDIVTTEVSAT